MAGYTIELGFPIDYPDQQPLADYLVGLRNDFVEFAESPPAHDRPYELTATSASYRSGGDSGTRSVVLRVSANANPRPVTWYKAFNYDLGTQRPITMSALLRPRDESC